MHVCFYCQISDLIDLTFSTADGVTLAVGSAFLWTSSDSSESDSDSAISELLGFLFGLRGRFGLDGGVACNGAEMLIRNV